jgi:uncharacterized protein DUF6895
VSALAHPPAPAGADPAARSLLESATGWLRTNLHWFRPEQWALHLPERAFDAQPPLELLLLARRLGPRHPFTAVALDAVAPVVDRDAVRAHLTRPDDLLRWWILLVALLHATGRPRPRLVALAQVALDAEFPDLSGTLPVEHLELRYALDLAGLSGPLAPAAELAAIALAELAGRADRLTSDDAYSLSHVVLYAADLGRRPLPLDPRPIAPLLADQLAVQIELGDHDLTAELVHCARIAGLADAPVVRRGLDALLAARHADGAVPSPPFDPTVQARLRGGVLAGYRFATRYHTTLVTALAAADRLLAGDAHPAPR